MTNRIINNSYDSKKNIVLSESRMRSNVAFVLGVNVYNTVLKAEKAMSYYHSRGEILA